ncbi:hypothetical protein SAMN05216288_4245 [Pseudomonas punonensis]|uniref:Uncharacterized protein n=1 Tax=Phytopseudomonas punonensis TaxID=1220495 RepID=A0A1M7LF33_9GAMM|nr:hypothetical protein SAMN05216288_4245 [Pseudomonas punonensis]
MTCPKCGYEPTMAEMQRSPNDCVSCGINYEGYTRKTAAQGPASLGIEAAAKSAEFSRRYPGAAPVVIIDVNMRFWSMVAFMVKWAIASIPALLIIMVLLVGVPLFLFGFVDSYSGYKDRSERRAEISSAHSKLDPPQKIFTPSESGLDYWLSYLSANGDLRTAIVTSLSSSGTRFGEITIDCLSGTGSELKLSDRIDSTLRSDSLPKTVIHEGTDRFYIAFRACRDAPRKHVTFQ